MRTMNSLRKTIPEPDDDESRIEQTFGGSLKGEDKQALRSVCPVVCFHANQNALQLTKMLHHCAV